MAKDYGIHYLVEYAGCDPERLKFAKDVEPVLMEAARKSRATILGRVFHQFEPEGVTGIILIAESHFSIHTWPETGFAAFDVLTCGEMDAMVAIEELKQQLKAARVQIREFKRGVNV